MYNRRSFLKMAGLAAITIALPLPADKDKRPDILLIIFAAMFIAVVFPATGVAVGVEDDNSLFRQAIVNGHAANEGFTRCNRYVHGWLDLADPQTGLIPRNTRNNYWNAKDAAADNYAFMVLTSSLTDRSLFEGRMTTMLETEIALTSRVDRLPDTYDFKKQAFLEDDVKMPVFR